VAVVDKAEILKTLRTIANFDEEASPFTALSLSNAKFYRSSAFGYIMSKNTVVDASSVYVSVSHLQDCLRAMPEEKLELALDNKTVVIKSIAAAFKSELRVHTVEVQNAGLKKHTIGNIKTTLSPDIFKGFDIKPFDVAAAPLVREGRLLVVTPHGTVIWTGPESLKALNVQSNPRVNFLRFIGNGCENIIITDNGYWGALGTDLVSFISGHNIAPHLFQLYDVKTETLATVPADRLVEVLKAAAGLCDAGRKVEINPKEGVTAEDAFGNVSKFGLGDIEGLPQATIPPQSAKLIVDALSQTSEENAVLYWVEQKNPLLRVTRGSFEVNIKTISGAKNA
jgi:hypothetical protein